MDTFPDGYVRIGVAVKQQERGLDLIGVEQRALLGKELRGVPRISAGIRYGAIAISPDVYKRQEKILSSYCWMGLRTCVISALLPVPASVRESMRS